MEKITLKNIELQHNAPPLSFPLMLKENALNSLLPFVEKSYLYQPNEYVCHAGQQATHLFIIHYGSTKDSITTINGAEQVTDFYLPSEIIGLESISTGKYLCDTIALEKSNIFFIRSEKLLHFATRVPTLKKNLLYLIGEKLLHRTSSLVTTHLSAEYRIAIFLKSMAERYKNIGFSETDYYISMSRYDIGSHLNLTTETVSRMFTKLQKLGILSVHKKHIKIINPKKLTDRYQH